MGCSIYLFYLVLFLVHAVKMLSVKIRNNVVLGGIEMLTKKKSVPQ